MKRRYDVISVILFVLIASVFPEILYADDSGTLPTITLLGDNPMNFFYGETFTEPGWTAEDGEDGDLTAQVFVSYPYDMDTWWPVGTWTVAYILGDSDSNVAQTFRRVTVSLGSFVDVEAPVITLEGDNEVDISLGAAYREPGASAADAVFGDLTEDIVVDSANVDVSRLGTYQVTYNVTDPAGNRAEEKIRIVHVVPGEELKAVPVPLSPPDGAPDVPFDITLEVNNPDPEGEDHAKTQWQIGTRPDFSGNTIVYDYTSSADLYRIILTPYTLDRGTTYYWHARFIDFRNGRTAWSETVSFTSGTTGGTVVIDPIQDDSVEPGGAFGGDRDAPDGCFVQSLFQ